MRHFIRVSFSDPGVLSDKSDTMEAFKIRKYQVPVRQTLHRLMSSWPVALPLERYRWFHECVLSKTAYILEGERKKARPKFISLWEMKRQNKLDIFRWSVYPSKCYWKSSHGIIPWIEESQIPRPGRHTKEKRLENSDTISGDLLQMFPISISIENAGGFNEEQERQQRRPLWQLDKEHSVWLSKPNLKPMYVDGLIDNHFPPLPTKHVSSITGRNIWWRMETQLMASMFSSDFYNYIHVIVLQT